MLTAALLASAIVTAPAKINWAPSEAAAFKAAKASGKLIMVDFFTDWCFWCKELDKNTFPAPQVVELSKSLVAVKLDAEKEGLALAEKHGVNGFPTILFLRPDGTEFSRLVGYKPAAPFAADMTDIISAHSSSKTIAARLAANPDDKNLNLTAAMVYGVMGRVDAAESAFRKAELAGANGEQMGKSANRIGDIYQNAGDMNGAITWFEVARFYSGGSTAVEEYALISIAYCWMSMENMDEAKKAAQLVLNLKGASKEARESAQGILESGEGM